VRINISRIAAAVIAVAVFGQLSIANAEVDVDAWVESIQAESDINRLAWMYLDIGIQINPPSGGSQGIHGTAENPTAYDDHLADVSAAGWDARYKTEVAFRDRLLAIDESELSRADQIDRHILLTQAKYSILRLTTLSRSTDPATYVSGVASPFSGLVLRDYAPADQRLRSFGSRCSEVGTYLDNARIALSPDDVRPTAVNKQSAMGRLKGTVGENGLFKKVLVEMIRESTLSEAEATEIQKNCAAAVAHIESFTTWFEETIVPREDGEWRLGTELYDEAYALYMDYPLSPSELLVKAEQALTETNAQLVATARSIHDGYLATQIADGSIMPAADLDDSQVVKNVFAEISKDHSTADTLIADSYALADAIVGFVEEKNLMDLPPTSKLRIENVPPHLQGYAVAQITTAPAFEPELESVWFWDLELLAGADDFLKEYNRPALALVYIHEGVPGHFVQLEYSNKFERIVPKVFGNGAMIEGWASYIATQLVEEGFTIYPDEPYGYELQYMSDRKLVLRSIINAIIDIRLHTSDWTEEEAVKMMVEQGFQEQGEADGKLNRAKMGYVQLTSYFAGHQAILEILEEYKKAKGDAFSYKDFNERLVGAGSPPFFAIREFMLAED